MLRQLHDEIDEDGLNGYGWSDLLPLLKVANANDAAAVVGAASAAKLLAGLSECIAAEAAPTALLDPTESIAAEAASTRAAAVATVREEARGLVRWMTPEFQHPTAPTPTQQNLPAETPMNALPAAPLKAKAWPQNSVAQVRALAESQLPQLLEMLVALARAT